MKRIFIYESYSQRVKNIKYDDESSVPPESEKIKSRHMKAQTAQQSHSEEKVFESGADREAAAQMKKRGRHQQHIDEEESSLPFFVNNDLPSDGESEKNKTLTFDFHKLLDNPPLSEINIMFPVPTTDLLYIISKPVLK